MYGFLGFMIFGIVGIIIASQFYGDELFSATPFNLIVGGITLAGTIALVIFARWMNKSGNTRLISLAAHPEVDWGIIGAISGGYAAKRLAEYLDPTYSMRSLDLIGIFAGIILSAVVFTRIARKLDLPPLYKK